MSRFPAVLLGATLAWASIASSACGEQPFAAPGEVKNAALVYWQAFSLLPQLREEEAALLAEAEKEPSQSAAKKLLEDNRIAITLVEQVGPRTPCEWGLIAHHPYQLFPHLPKARLLAKLIILRSRADAAAGHIEAAVDRLTIAFLLARNVDEGMMTQSVVGAAIETASIDAAYKLLPELDASTARRFAKAMSQLPPRVTLAQTMRYERDYAATELRPTLENDEKARQTLEELRQTKDDGPNDDAYLSSVLDGIYHGWTDTLVLPQEERMKHYRGFLSAYDEVIRAAELPLAEAHDEFERITYESQESSNPLIRGLLPGVTRMRFTIPKHEEIHKRFTELNDAVLKVASGAGQP